MNTMNNIELLTTLILAVPRGHFVSVAWERPAKVKKAAEGMKITKRVEGRARVGIEYDNVKDVKECRADGILPEENNGGRPCWFHYPEGMWPFIAEHNTKGTRYICLYFAKGDNSKTAFLRSCWLIDGKPAAYNEVEPFLLAADKKKEAGKDANTFRPSMENLTRFTAEGKAINWKAKDYQPIPELESGE